MKVQWKRNPLYPSTQKPGVFAFSSSLDESGAELNTNKWRDLNGIDEEQLNTFKFALGTWTVFSRRTRQITKLTHEEVNSLQNEIASDQAEEPKPNEPPFDYLEKLRGEYDSIALWALDGEPILIKHDNDSNDLDDPEGDGAAITISQAKELDGGENTQFFGGWDDSKDADIRAQLSWQMGGTGNDRVSRRDLGGYDGGVARYYEKKVGRQTKAYSRWNKKGKITPGGYWEVYDKLRKTDGVNRQYLYFRPNFASSDFNDRNSRGTLSPNRQWQWEPSNGLVFDTDNGLEAYGKWIPSGQLNFIIKETSPIAENVYVGIATTTDEIDPQNLEPKDLLLYHDVDSPEYDQNSSPIEINFSLNFAEIDPHPDRVGEVIKYFVLEWGDEEDELTTEDILNSEFFEIYESDDNFYDKFTVKKVMQSISNSKKIEFGEVMDENENVLRSELDTHIYTEPGVKTIKCIVFRFDNSNEATLLETSLIYSQIFISDPNQKLQNFNIFGASDFTVLPLENEREFIFGSIDVRSDYAMSLKTIEVNDLYESSDYLEKIYNEEFLPNVSQSLYGEYAGNLDLGLTRIFTKPFDLYDFISADKLEWITIGSGSLPLNSSATEILISNEDCVVELDPSNKNNLEIENTAKSDEKGVVLGDYAIVKEKGEKFRKDDNMDLPRLEQKIDRQAF